MSVLRDTWIINKKELKGIFRDRRLVISITLVPFLIFPLIFGALGFFASVSITKIQEETLDIMIKGQEHAPLIMERINETQKFNYIVVENTTQALREEKIYLSVSFTAGFEQEINQSLNASLNLTLHYNSAVSRSNYALDIFLEEIVNYSRQIIYGRLEKVDLAPSALRPINWVVADEATTQQKSGAFLGQLVPYFVVIYLFAGAMNVGLDAITGEKERNTLSTLLVNRVKRESIVFGKMLSVMIIAFISAACTFGGIAVSLVGGMALLGGSAAELGVASLTPTVGFALLIVLIPLAALIVSIIVLIGTYAKSIKEGGSLIGPIYILVIVIGVATMGIDFALSDSFFALPFIGSMFALKNAFLGKLTAVQLLLSTITTIVFTAILVFFCVRMFKNEKVIFRI